MPENPPPAPNDTIVPVTIVGTGDGSVRPLDRTVALTPSPTTPNLLVKVVPPLLAIAIRFGNAYLTTLVGLIMAGMTSNILPAHDFMALVAACAKLSLAGPVVAAMKDVLTIFAGLERKYPLLSGSV